MFFSLKDISFLCLSQHSSHLLFLLNKEKTADSQRQQFPFVILFYRFSGGTFHTNAHPVPFTRTSPMSRSSCLTQV
jgi:hypothetical protein